MKQVVPEIAKLKNKYDMLWEQDSNEGYIKVCGTLQKYIDQSISANTSYIPANYSDGKVPMSVMLGEILLGYKLGIKNFYYANTHDGSGEVDVEKATASKPAFVLPPMPEDDGDCDSCKI